jgi:hypothetical protein
VQAVGRIICVGRHRSAEELYEAVRDAALITFKISRYLSSRPLFFEVLRTELPHGFGSKPREFLIYDRTRLLQRIELRDLVGDGEPNDVLEFVAALLSLLAFRSAMPRR